MSKLLTRILTKFVKLSELKNEQLELAYVVVATLKFFQAWPMGRTPLQDRIYFAFTFFYCNILLIGFEGHIVKLYISGELSYDAVAVDFSILTLGFSGYKYTTHMFKHRHRAQKLLRQMGDFRHYEKPPGIEISDAILNGIFKFIIVTLIIMTPLLLAILLPLSCEEDDYSCGFVYPAYYPGMMKSYWRKCSVILQMTSTWVYALVGTGSLWVGMHMSEYIISYLKHCQSITKKIASFENFEERRKYVKFVLKYHQRVLFLYKRYYPVAQGVFVVHAISTPIVMATMIHTFTIDFQIQCLLIFVIWTMTLFVVCFIGQRMMNESDKLAIIVFDIIPYDGDLVTTKLLMFMFQETQRPLKIPAGSLTFCNLQLFTNALKATYSYLAVLRTTNQN